MSDTLRDQWTSTGSSLYVYCQAGQSFVASSSFTMTELRLRLARGATYVATEVEIDLYNTNVSHEPTTLIGNIGSINTNTLSTSFATVYFTGLSFEITETIEYAIVIRITGVVVCISGTGSENNSVRVEAASGYSNGVGSVKSCVLNGSWACQLNWESAGRDWYFKVYGTEVPYKVINPDPEDDATGINRVTDLTWEVGDETADDYDVWFGTPGNMVLVGTEITDEVFSIQDYINEGVDPEDPTIYLDLDTEYEWRVDSYVDGELEATGDTWSYTTRVQRTVVLSSPEDVGIDVLLKPLLQWTIDGIGAQYGSFEDQDFLFIYLKKDDANFTEDDLLSNFLQAFANDDLQVVAGLEYGATYYWQVQAGNTAADLADSEVWSFTAQEFSPPIQSVHPISGLPTGENNMATIRRLVVAAKNKIFYEDI